MKAEDITSEQAWEDFKAGYSDFEEKHIGKDREGDKATLEDKLDIMNAKLTELNTDVSRLTDSVPQALGTIEEGKTIEEEAEESQELGEELGAEEGAENPEAEGGEDDLFGGEDDGLDEYFAEDGEEEEEGAESPEDEKADGDEDFAEDSDMETEKQGDEASESDSVVSADGDDNGDAEDVEEESSEDEDFIPIEDLDDSEEDEEPEEDEKEEVLEKMVRILTKMDRRITRLERENEGLKKQLSARTVQPQTTNVAKARPRPNTNLKLVKGSYNRPPVSTQYVANQRDVGVGVRKSESQGENTSVFRQGLNEVFEQCNRIANETH